MFFPSVAVVKYSLTTELSQFSLGENVPDMETDVLFCSLVNSEIIAWVRHTVPSPVLLQFCSCRPRSGRTKSLNWIQTVNQYCPALCRPLHDLPLLLREPIIHTPASSISLSVAAICLWIRVCSWSVLASGSRLLRSSIRSTRVTILSPYVDNNTKTNKIRFSSGATISRRLKLVFATEHSASGRERKQGGLAASLYSACLFS